MSSIIFSKTNKIATLKFNRPEVLNSLDPQAMKNFRECLIEFRDDSDLLVCIITGAGDKSFCTGADLKKTLPPRSSFASAFFRSEAESIEQGLYIRGLDITGMKINKPIIAAINGFAIGGGLEIALNCDIRIASDNASLGLSEAKVGSIPAIGGIQRLFRYIPTSLAMQMLLTGERISAAEAYRVGLVSKVCPLNELLQESYRIAEKICENGPISIQAIKYLIRKGLNMPLDEAIALEQMMWGLIRDTEDRIEGRNAFEQKRKPVFKGY
ncbi:MAG: enoyl-CoA hydratase-related protein [Pseudomonadota bacterium]